MDRESAPPEEKAPTLATVGVAKAFGPVEVLSDISLEFRAGQVHAIVGENGAGKSTLMKILSGHERPTRGQILLGGAPVAFAGPNDAERHGVALVHQELQLAPHLSVAQNMFLGRELRGRFGLDDRAMNARAAAAMGRLGAHVDVSAPVHRLSVAQRQMAQIARALDAPRKVVIFDEPTASLTPVEAGALMALIGALKQGGVAVLYISHRLEEVKAVADIVTVLRDGRWVATRPAAELRPVDMARLMVGRELSQLYPARAAAPTGEARFSAKDFTTDEQAAPASLALRPGEILGIAGLVGAGRTELFEAIVALRKGEGALTLEGAPVRFATPRAAMDEGVVYLTEDRKTKGLLLGKPLAQNLTLAALGKFTRRLVVDRAAEAKALEDATRRFDIRVRDPSIDAGQMSGGNQQKLLIAKMTLLDPKVIVIDEPTRGVDVGAKQQIYKFLADFAAQGKSVVVISSEMGELIGLCHRILVMRAGKIVGEVAGEDMTEQKIVELATGVAGAAA